MGKRITAILVVALLVGAAAIAYLNLRDDSDAVAARPTLDEMATSLGTDIMRHLYRGHAPGRSAEIMTVPKPHHYMIGGWDYTTLGTDTPFLATSHPNPWNYLARVPMIFYGPGYIDEGQTHYDEVDIASLAPTYARILGMDGFEAAACSYEQIVACDSTGGVATKPKVIFTVVLDGGGWNALNEHPDSHPTIDRLREQGTTYVNNTIGSAPSITGALHATFGTGFYPRDHGLPGNQMRGPNGENTDTWKQNADPEFLLKPAVSELWDEANDNEPIVGTVSYEGWHLGMIGHGALRDGADKDIAVLWEVERNELWANEDFWEFPDYLEPTDLATLESYEESLDPQDGLPDGLWFGHTLEELQEKRTRPGTPAFVEFTGDVVVDVMRNEGIGEDDVTDMFWVEMKMPDFTGHLWNMLGPEEAAVLTETDAQIARFKKELDALAGPGNYILTISADHGQQPLPDNLGGWRINQPELRADLEAEFGPVIEKVSPVDLYIYTDLLEENDTTLEDIARFLGSYTLGDNIPEDVPGTDRVPEGRRDDLLFAAAFPTGYLTELTDEEIDGFGDGEYPEGDFTIEPQAGR